MVSDRRELRARAERFLATPAATAVDWFDVGLLAKADHDWVECARINREALERGSPGDGNPAAWNAGIAYTALGQWRKAREMWTAFGIQMAINDEPIDEGYGWTPVRLNPEEPTLEDARPPIMASLPSATVWILRRSPAHGRIVSVPLPETRHRYGDVVLHDGAPTGERVIDGRTVSAFDELAVLERSSAPTWQITVTADGPALEALAHRATELDVGMDDWSAVRMLCRDCSQGNPDVGNHAHAPSPSESTRLGIGGPEAVVRSLLDWWSTTHPRVDVRSIELVWDADHGAP